LSTNDLPQHARERLADMRARKLFTSDLSVNEFLLVKEAGFEPLGLVMGTSIYQINPGVEALRNAPEGRELTEVTRALYHARELAMTRMEDEADALGADGIIGVRLTVNLDTNPQQAQNDQFRRWQRWAKEAGFPQVFPARNPSLLSTWPRHAAAQWSAWCRQRGWAVEPPAPWAMPRPRASFALGRNAAEFLAVGTAVRHAGGGQFKNHKGKPFQSDLSGQDFWMLVRAGYRPVGFVMGNCVYYVPPAQIRGNNRNHELVGYTHALYDARELAVERMQDEAEELLAQGIVGVSIDEHQHSWRSDPASVGQAALVGGELIELLVVGTAVVPFESERPTPAELVISLGDAAPAPGGSE
jgi:uncharacterized protein YbjQ (UPF0145 family)